MPPTLNWFRRISSILIACAAGVGFLDLLVMELRRRHCTLFALGPPIGLNSFVTVGLLWLLTFSFLRLYRHSPHFGVSDVARVPVIGSALWSLLAFAPFLLPSEPCDVQLWGSFFSGLDAWKTVVGYPTILVAAVGAVGTAIIEKRRANRA